MYNTPLKDVFLSKHTKYILGKSMDNLLVLLITCSEPPRYRWEITLRFPVNNLSICRQQMNYFIPDITM